MATHSAQLYHRDPHSVDCEPHAVGGKARNLWLLGKQVDCPVPDWFVLTTTAFTAFLNVCVYMLYIFMYH